MRLFLGLFILLFAVACGGGGGGVAPDPDPDPDPDPMDDARTQEILQDCLPDLLAEAQELAQLLDAIFQGGGNAAGAELPSDGTGGFVVDGPPDNPITFLQFEYDPSGGGLIEGNGQLAFEDGSGGPAAIFTEPQVDTLRAGGIDAFGALVASIPDGTVVRASYNGAGAEPSILDFAITVQGGVLSATSGNLEMQLVGCVARLVLDGDAFGGLITAFPSGTFDITLQADVDEVIGTLVTGGTVNATATVSRNAAADTNWTINLTSGAATQVP